MKLKKGAVLIELLLSLALGSAILAAVGQALSGSSESNLRSYQQQQAQLYLEEASEAVKTVAQTDWHQVDTAGFYHPVISSGLWDLEPEEEVLDLEIFKRRVAIEDLFRDQEGNIATQGGTLDPSTKKVTTKVSWQQPRPGELNQTFFISRWQENVTWIEDSLEDFSDGIEDSTDAVINPGYVQLAQTGGGGWTEPASIGTVDARNKASGVCANDSYIYLIPDKFWAGAEIFEIESSPATPSSVAYFEDAYRPNDCTVIGNYLYIANSYDILPSIYIYSIAADPTDPDWINARGLLYPSGGLWATDDYLFVSEKSDKHVYVYRLSGGHYDDPWFLGWFNTPEDTVDVAVSGNYLYLAQESTAKAVEIYDISANPVAPTHVSTLSTVYEPTGIWTESNILYLSMKGKRGAMYSIAANPTNPQLYGYFPTQRNTADVAAFGDYGYVAGADSQLKAIEVFDLSDSKGISGIYFVYGEYISSSFDASAAAAFNRLSWEGEEVANTNIMFQIATNDDDFTWDFVGPDGTLGSYFEEPGPIPLNYALGRYFRYKMILIGDGDSTPTVDKVKVNYSP